jgi:hypothetical protein
VPPTAVTDKGLNPLPGAWPGNLPTGASNPFSFLPLSGAGGARSATEGVLRPSNVQRPAKGVQRRLVHAFADRRVREDRGEEVGLGGFQGHGQGVALDHLGDIGADHVGADQGELR